MFITHNICKLRTLVLMFYGVTLTILF